MGGLEIMRLGVGGNATAYSLNVQMERKKGGCLSWGRSEGEVRRKKIYPSWCGSVVECWPVNQRVTGLIPSLGHMLGL